MQVATSLFYDRSSTALTTLSGRADLLQTQIATGKRLAKASDDSVAYTRLQTIARATADASVDGKNLDLAASALATADTTLSGITAQLQRASELAIQARSGTLDATAREAIAAELDTIVDQLTALGNGSDPRGQPLFGGVDGGPAVAKNTDGTFTLATTLPSAIPIGEGQTVQPGDTAVRVFGSGANNALATVAGLAAALHGGGAASAQAVDDLAAAATRVTTVQASLGARAARVEVEQAALKQTGADREALRSGLEDTDVTAAITELQKTMTILSATQASFTKLQGLSLFDYLR